MGGSLLGGIYPWGKRNSMKRVKDFLALLYKKTKKKNNENINMKKFFQLKVRRRH